MKKSTVLFTIAFAIFFISCASDSSTNNATAKGSSTTPTIENTGVANEVSKVLTKGSDAADAATDELVPSDDKIDKTVDKVADKIKGILKKGKEEVAGEIKKTTDVVTKKADEVVENISKKSEEIGNKIENKIETTAAKVEAKVDDAIAAIPESKTTSKPAPPTETSQTTAPKKEVKETATKDIVNKKVWGKNDKPNHDYFNDLLKKYVTADGTVNYKGFKADDHLLEDYLSQLKNNPVNSDWTKKEKLAYWINAYNAFTIKLIVDNYPISSIQKLDGGKPWDRKWIKIGDKTYSLNNIENDIIRPQFNEPRIHFAVNCAAKSCPPLSNSAWTPANLEEKFETATKKFINNSQYNAIDKNGATVSKIFDWYKEDFGDLTAFLNKYSDVQIKSGGKIKFMDYNWGLNE